MKGKLHPPLDTAFPLWDLAVMCRAMRSAGRSPTKKLERQLIKAAQKWLPYAISNAPWGNYDWLFTVEMEMERRWNWQEFRAGRRYGRNSSDPDRDANPYKECHARLRSWDRGYILGLEERIR